MSEVRNRAAPMLQAKKMNTNSLVVIHFQNVGLSGLVSRGAWWSLCTLRSAGGVDSSVEGPARRSGDYYTSLHRNA